MPLYFTTFHHSFIKILLCSLILLASSVSAAKPLVDRENQLMSAFVYKVAKFITWPHINELTKTDHFDLCVVDNAEFTQSLKQAVKLRRILKLDIHVFNVLDDVDLKHCHVLYFQHVKSKKVVELLQKTQGKPILTIASSDDFIDQGGMIAFGRQNNKISLSINNTKAVKEGLIISAHLLRLNRLKK